MAKDSTPGSPGRKADQPRRRGLGSIATNIPRIIAPAMRKRGAAIARLIAHWPEVVGGELSDVSLPERFSRGKDGTGTLVVRVSGSFALEMQHLEPLVLEKINGFLGGNTVTSLRLVHGTVTPRPRPRPRPEPPLNPAIEERVRDLTRGIEDEDLRNALDRLGRSILRAPARDRNAT